MSNVKQFSITHTESTSATAAQVWALWENVNNWPAWDVGLEHCNLKGAFEAGSSFTLRPRGAPNEINVEITEVIQNKGFSDQTNLPFGVLRTRHRYEETDSGNTITHMIEADVMPEQAEFFENVIWSGMETGLPESVRNLVRMAESRP